LGQIASPPPFPFAFANGIKTNQIIIQSSPPVTDPYSIPTVVVLNEQGFGYLKEISPPHGFAKMLVKIKGNLFQKNYVRLRVFWNQKEVDFVHSKSKGEIWCEAPNLSEISSVSTTADIWVLIETNDVKNALQIQSNKLQFQYSTSAAEPNRKQGPQEIGVAIDMLANKFNRPPDVKEPVRTKMQWIPKNNQVETNQGNQPNFPQPGSQPALTEDAISPIITEITEKMLSPKPVVVRTKGSTFISKEPDVQLLHRSFPQTIPKSNNFVKYWR